MGSFVAARELWVVMRRLPRWYSGKEFGCQCRRLKKCRFDPWVREISWRRQWQPSPVFLLEESHGQRSLAGYSPWGFDELDMTERLSTLTWDLVPWQGWNLGPLHWACGVLVTAPPGKSLIPTMQRIFFLNNFINSQSFFKFHILIPMGTIIFKYQKLLHCYVYFFLKGWYIF